MYVCVCWNRLFPVRILLPISGLDSCLKELSAQQTKSDRVQGCGNVLTKYRGPETQRASEVIWWVLSQYESDNLFRPFFLHSTQNVEKSFDLIVKVIHAYELFGTENLWL